MLGTSRVGSFRLLLRQPAVVRTLFFVLLGRLAYGVLPLSLLFTIRDASGSFSTAAFTSAAFGLGALAMPYQARLIDRYGQRRVLPWYTVGFAGLLLTLCAVTWLRPTIVSIGWPFAGVALGLTAPGLGPAMRAQWRVVADTPDLKRAAYSLDSVAEESLYLVGPIVAAVMLVVGPARL
jgi:MFS family permease